MKRIKTKHIRMSSRKTHETFLREINDMWGKEFTILGQYVKAIEKLKVRHNICGKEMYKTPNSLLNGKGCLKCSYIKNGKNRARTTYQFKKEVYELVGDEYSVLGVYKKNTKPIKMKHNSCGNVWEPVPAWFLRGTRCPECMKKLSGLNRRWTHEKFANKVYELEQGEYSVMSKYIKSNIKVKIKHNKCENIYKVDPAMFLSGNRCPICVSLSKSNGEKFIYSYLKTKHIEFKSEYKFDDCINIMPLPFDFAIYSDSNLVGLIEFDGEQHFKPVEIFGGIEQFNATKINDSIKNNYCKEKQIPLLRISYLEIRKIHEILDKYLDSLGL